MADTKKKAGCKSKFDTVILPNLEQIEKWIKNGATEKQICGCLGIGVSTFNAHKDKPELQEAIQRGRSNLIMDLRGELARIALKHTIKTTKTYIKQEEGKDVMYTEQCEKEVDGDVGAIHLLLKNLDREEWKNDWGSYEFKKRELELKEKIAENALWK